MRQRHAILAFAIHSLVLLPLSAHASSECKPWQRWIPPTDSAPGRCEDACDPETEIWHEEMGHCMSKPADTPRARSFEFGFHGNQFIAGVTASGPRGRNAVTAPNMFMVDASRGLGRRHSLRLSCMLTTDRWTVPSHGTPQPLQSGEKQADGTPYVDAQHPHSSPIMGCDLGDTIALGDAGDRELTLFFAPRGEATAGPTTFMHRESARGNLQPPLAHHLQDFLHITSTVLGARYRSGGTTVSASTFSGVEPCPTCINLDMHRPDSFGVKVEQALSDAVQIGASFADVRSADHDEAGGDEADHHDPNTRYLNAWLSSRHRLGRSTLNTTTIASTARGSSNDAERLSSFLSEATLEAGRNLAFARIEALQRTPGQLDLQVSDDSGAQWIGAITLGGERQLARGRNYNLAVGGSLTQTMIPNTFKPAYNRAPRSLEVHMRVGLGRHRH